ncbi:MAG: hypothetical protein WKI04_15370 [Ferruginibacter sp.]
MKMFRLLSLTWLLFISFTVFSQDNVGIGVVAPTQALSIDRGINLDHNNQNPGSSLLNGLRFGNTATNLQMVGITSNRSGAAEPFSLDFYTAKQRRMIITQAGLVGINAVPTGYFLEVGGTVRGSTLRAAGSVFAETGSVISENAVTAGTSISAGTNITATNNIIATTGDIVATNGELRADGRGVVMSNSATRQRIVAYSATLSVSGLGVGSSVTGAISISAGTFTSAPTAYVGNVITENGEYYKVMLVLENVTTSNITIRVVNVSSDAVSFSGAQWRILAIGAF